ncbi:MAG: lysophospholipid acyltransferase family protein [Bacillota bacterium]
MLYWLVRGVFRVYYRLFARWRVAGRENLPKEGAVLLCANHVHWMDPVNLACAIDRPVYFMAKSELFEIPVFSTILSWIGAFPVRRGKPDRSALRHTFRLLDERKVVGMFPEGTRSRTGKLGRAEPGLALIALKSQAVICPAAITGDYGPFRRINLRLGRPMSFPELYGVKVTPDDLARVSAAVMEQIASLMQADHVEAAG